MSVDFMPMTDAVQAARECFDAAIRSVQADVVFRDLNWEELTGRPLGSYRRVAMAGMGKAALASVSVLERVFPVPIDEGYAVVPEGYVETLPDRFDPPRRIEVGRGGHPLPDEGSVRAARRVLDIADRLKEDDLLVLLISGGGSALCTDFPQGISLEDAKVTFDLLLGAGVDIHAINTVRKHMTRIGGGRLAEVAAPAAVAAVVISDVVDDDLSVIASGPTVADPTTFEDAVRVLREASLWESVPESVRRHLGGGCRTGRGETPKPGAAVFEGVVNRIAATNRTAVEAAARAAEAQGFAVRIVREPVTGEARELIERLLAEASVGEGSDPVCLVAGGETTVTVRGEGRGGRNQEAALAAVLALEEARRPTVFLCGGTDGIDGPTDAAGAVVTHETAARARRSDEDPRAYLDRNDSYAFFERVGGHVRTGPTHTNVMDVALLLTSVSPLLQNLRPF